MRPGWDGWSLQPRIDLLQVSGLSVLALIAQATKHDYLQSLLTSLVFSPSLSSLRTDCTRGYRLPNAIDLRMYHDLPPDQMPLVLE